MRKIRWPICLRDAPWDVKALALTGSSRERETEMRIDLRRDSPKRNFLPFYTCNDPLRVYITDPIQRFSGPTASLRGSCRFYILPGLKRLIGPFFNPIDGSTGRTKLVQSGFQNLTQNLKKYMADSLSHCVLFGITLLLHNPLFRNFISLTKLVKKKRWVKFTHQTFFLFQNTSLALFLSCFGFRVF